MFDRDAPTTQAALREYGKPEIRRKLLQYATWRTQDVDVAKDLVAEALYRLCDPDDKPWNDPKRSFFKHFRRVMGDLAIESNRVGFGYFETVDSEHEAFDRARQPGPLPDAAVHAKRKLEWMRAMMRTLLARVGRRDRIVVELHELACEGRHDEPDELAAALGVRVPVVYEAMRRLRYHGLRVRAAWEDKEKERMAALRERSGSATKKGRP